MYPPNFRGIFRDDFPARAVYSEGAGIARCIPTAVAVPRDAEDVRALVEWARSETVPLVPRGSGSGMAGGAVGAGVIVDLSQLRDIGEVEIERRRVWTQPGALRAQVNARAAEHDLRFPVDPSSGPFCTVGGMAATNASGAHTLQMGPSRTWISALDCVFDDGSRAVVRRGEAAPSHVSAVRRFLDAGQPAVLAEPRENLVHAGVRKNSSGYALAEYARSGELVDLLVGSEGTLAIFVGVELELAPRPRTTSSILAAFKSLDDAFAAAAAATEAGASACELLDRTFLDLVATSGGGTGLPSNTEAVLLAETEAETGARGAGLSRRLSDIFRDAGATDRRVALDAGAEAALWSLRHAASPILSRLDRSLKSMQFIEDGAVPPDRVAEYVRSVRAALDRNLTRGVIFGHAGDAHVHVNPLVDVRDPAWRSRVSALLDEIVGLTADLGGVLSGEHGDGRLRTPLLERAWSERARSLFATVKHCFDPLGILNPGVKVPEEAQRALNEIKYDPFLAPLPPEVRAALDSIEGDRAWHRFRLSLI